MHETPDLATIGALLGQPARAAMLGALMDGRARTATELADAAGVSRATASSHLALLTEGGLLAVAKQGRHRYYRLAGPEVADTLERLMALAPPAVPRSPAKPVGPGRADMRRARMCYDHIAGQLGVGITDALVARGALVEDEANFRLTGDGERFLQSFGIDVEAARRRKRHFARTCLDWSERRPHLAGALGAAVAERMFGLGWIERELEGRTLLITPAGLRGLRRVFDIEIEPA